MMYESTDICTSAKIPKFRAAQADRAAKGNQNRSKTAPKTATTRAAFKPALKFVCAKHLVFMYCFRPPQVSHIYLSLINIFSIKLVTHFRGFISERYYNRFLIDQICVASVVANLKSSRPCISPVPSRTTPCFTWSMIDQISLPVACVGLLVFQIKDKYTSKGKTTFYCLFII